MKKITVYLLFVFCTLQLSAQHFPVVINDSAYTICQVPVSVNVLLNDYDLEGDSMRIFSAYIENDWGDVEYIDSTIIYTPSNLVGQAMIKYRIQKTNLPEYEGEAYLVVNVNDNPDLPIAENDFTSVMVLDTVLIEPLINDFDPNAEPFKIHDVYSYYYYQNWLEFNDSSIWYSPEHIEEGVDTIDYSIIQLSGNGYYSRDAKIIVEVNDNPNLPVAFPDTVYTYDQIPTLIYPLTNDWAPAGEEIYIKDFSPLYSIIELNDSSVQALFPPTDYNVKKYRYKIALVDNENYYSDWTDLVVLINDNPERPVAVADSIMTQVQKTTFIYPLTNDYDPNNVPFRIKNDGIGSFFCNDSTLCVKYHYEEIENLEYSIIQTEGDEYYSKESLIRIKVEENPDLPVAVNDTVTTYGGVPIEISVLDNDYDPNGKEIKIKEIDYHIPPDSIYYNDSVIVYYPPLSLVDTFKLFYKIVHLDSLYYSKRGYIIINVLKNPELPVANDDYAEIMLGTEVELNLLRNDYDPQGDSLEIENLNGPITFSQISDSSVLLSISHWMLNSFIENNICEIGYKVRRKNNIMTYSYGKYTVKILDNPDWPVANDDYGETTGGIPVRIDILNNDFNPEGFPIVIEEIRSSNRTACRIEDTTVLFTPCSNFSGVDTIYYRCREINSFQSSTFSKVLLSVSETNSYRELSVNNISAGFNASGYNFSKYDHLPFYNIRYQYYPQFEVPKNSNINSIFCSNLWLGGYDQDGELYLAAEMYSHYGCDYWAGPVKPTYDSAEYNLKWNRMWKVSRSDILNHEDNWQTLHYTMKSDIKSWPAGLDFLDQDGNTYAPFADVNKNSIYDPATGDYPLINGDEALFFLYSDDKYEHLSKGKILGVEVLTMPYAFSCPEDSAFYNTVFIDYKIINRSDLTYTDFYIGNFVDIDIGKPTDDYSGCDTNLNLFFVYNSDKFDEDYKDNYENPCKGYSNYPPAVGALVLNQKLNGFNKYIPYQLDWTSPQSCYNLISGYWHNGEPITYGGSGEGGLIETKYFYPGDPSDDNSWNEVSSMTYPGDRKVIGSVGPFTFHPGDTIELELAYIFARDYEGDNLSSVTLLKERAQTIQEYYDLGISPCGSSWTVPSKEQVDLSELQLFPNPARTDVVILYEPVSDNADLKVYDITGKQVLNGKLDSNIKHQISIQNLSSGLYIFIVQDGTNTFTKKLVKQPN